MKVIHTNKWKTYNTSISYFIIIFFLLTFPENIFPQYQIDFLYLFSDNTKFNDNTITVTGDITNLAVKFNTVWDKYEIFKISLMLPSSIPQNEMINYNISTGGIPEQNIFYKGNFYKSVNYPNWQYVDISPPVQVSNTNIFYIFGFIIFISVISDYSRTFYNNEFKYSIDRNEWSEGAPAYFAIKVFIRKSLTDIKREKTQINKFYLEQNYPNPFNPTTIISYQLSAFSYVSLKVYDVLGKEVATLVDEMQNAGTHTVIFNSGQTANHKQLSSGVYFYRITIRTPDNKVVTKTKKMVLLSEREKKEEEKHEQKLYVLAKQGNKEAQEELSKIMLRKTPLKMRRFVIEEVKTIIPEEFVRMTRR